MNNAYIQDRGHGPELVGTRLTVYNLVPDFLDPTKTEAIIGQLYSLTPEQVAAARAAVFEYADTVLARHLEIEARNARGNSPETIEKLNRMSETFAAFRQWLAGRPKPAPNDGQFPTFREWFAQQRAEEACKS